MSTYSVCKLDKELNYDTKNEIIDTIIKEEFPEYRRIDDGAYATIYGKPRSRTVVKFAFNDTAYTKFARFCVAHQDNPWLPRIKSVRLYVGKNKDQKVTVVVMERLRSCSYGEHGYDFAELVRRYIGRYSPSTEHEEDEMSNRILGFCKQANLIQHLQAIRLFLKKVTSRSGGALDYDLHSQNVMRRGKEGLIVITDPLC